MNGKLSSALLFVLLAVAWSSFAGRAFADEAADKSANKSADSKTVESAADSSAAIEDVFYLGDDRLVAIRFHLFVDGQPYRTAWTTFLDDMFERLDADDNRELTGDERRGIPSRSLMANFEMLSGSTVASRLGVEPDFAPRDGKVTRQELGEYFERVGLSPFRVNLQTSNMANNVRILGGRAVSTEDAPRVLLELLDANGDEKLDADEFRNAPEQLRKHDLDRDEAISMTELTPIANLFGVVRSSEAIGSRDAGAMFLSRGSPASRRDNVERLLTKYDGRGGAAEDKDGRLSRQELGYDAESFAPLDVDGDGQLDFEEALQLLSNPAPQHEVSVRLGKRKPGQAAFEFRDAAAGRVVKDMASLTFGPVQLELAAADVARQGAKERLQFQFKSLDRDNNGYVDTMEGRQFGLAASRITLLDADGDGKLFEEELLAALTPLFELDERRLLLQIGERGRDLFRILDTGGDNRIGLREFRAAIERLPLWDTGADGAVELDEIPQQYRLVVTRGSPNLYGRVQIPPAASTAVRVRSPASQSAPAWFSKMDRNGDGDLSPVEFLGTAGLFQKLDADSDRLIDPQEASAARR